MTKDANDIAQENGSAAVREAWDEAADQAKQLAAVQKVARRWLGDEYDMDSLNACLATAAAERLPGDPPWLLIVSAPGNTKTETVSALKGAGAHITSTIQSEGALLSASPKRERTKGATGGLLRKIGKRGILVIKDVTTILSASREVRGPVLAALREIYDGLWERNVGTDGGRTLTWVGRIVVVGAVTTAWDTAHSVIATMGDRFVLVRTDSHKGRIGAGLNALRGAGHEPQMREELAAAVGKLIGGVDPKQPFNLTDEEADRIVRAANVTTMARTSVELDHRGDVEFAHMPEAPTRFAKQLVGIFRGALAIGMDRRAALNLIIRCARDSMPALRLAILEDIGANPRSRPGEIRKRVDQPRRTVDRQCQALHMLGLVTCDEETWGSDKTIWLYRLREGLDIGALEPWPEMSVTREKENGSGDLGAERGVTDVSGQPVQSANGHGQWLP